MRPAGVDPFVNPQAYRESIRVNLNVPRPDQPVTNSQRRRQNQLNRQRHKLGSDLGDHLDMITKGEYYERMEAEEEQNVMFSGCTSEEVPRDLSCISERVIRAAKMALSIDSFTATQRHAIPLIMHFPTHDIKIKAQPGSGKTLSFLLPIVQTIYNLKYERDNQNCNFINDRSPYAVVLCPTRDLAVAQYKYCSRYLAALSSNISAALSVGQMEMKETKKSLETGCDLLFCTAGRLIDGFGVCPSGNNGSHGHAFRLSVDKLRFVVIDEASHFLSDREGFDDGRKAVVDFFTHVRVESPASRVLAVMRILERHSRLMADGSTRRAPKTLIFANSRAEPDRVLYQLRHGGFLGSVVISSERTMAQRMGAIAKFNRGEADILVASDVAAKGLNFEDLQVIIQMELPGAHLGRDKFVECFINRVGRTGRLGNGGKAYHLVDMEHEVNCLPYLTDVLMNQYEETELPPFLQEYCARRRPYQ